MEEGLLEQKLQSLRFWPEVEQQEGMTAGTWHFLGVCALGEVGGSRLGVQTAAVLSPGARSPVPLSTPQLCSSVTSHKPESQKSSWPFLPSTRSANQLFLQWSAHFL